jgi:putative transposase
VRTLMLRMGIRAMAPQPGSSKPAPGHTGSTVPGLKLHGILMKSSTWQLNWRIIVMARLSLYCRICYFKKF